MSTQLQLRRGNTSQHSAFTGVIAEVTVDTDKHVVVVHDGVTAGGFPAPTLTFTQAAFDKTNTNATIISNVNDRVNTAFDGIGFSYSNANAAYDQANTGTTIAQAAYFHANAAFDHSNSSYDLANTANAMAFGAFAAGNLTTTYAQAGFGVANSAYSVATSKVSKAGDTMTGTLNVPTINVASNVTSGNVNVTGDIDANNIIIETTLYSGLATRQATPLPNLIAQFTGNTDSYVQVNAQNIDPQGSGDFVVTADVGNDTTFYIDMGMQGSELSQGALHPLDGYLIVQGNTGQLGGNLVVGTSITGTETHIVVGGLEESNVVAIFTDDLTTTFTGNVKPSVDNTQYLGSADKRWHTIFVGPGSVDIDGVVLSNNNGQLEVSGASDIVLVGSTVPTSSQVSETANLAYDQANTATALGQAAFDYANTLIGLDDTSDMWMGNVANAAYAHANAGFARTNSAYTLANSNYSFTTDVQAYANAGYAQANTATTLGQAAFDEANTKFASAGGTITGSVTITGQANVENRLSVGTGSFTILPNLIAQFTGTSDYYSQINQQNLSGNGSGDIVVTADNGTDQVNFIDMGITGSTYDNTTPNAYPPSQPNDGYLYLVGNPDADFGGNLVIGAVGSGSYADISIIQGTGFAETARFINDQGLVIYTGTASVDTTSGALVVDGGVGISGDLHASTVSADGVELKTYIETANTFLQGNDATTLAASKTYTDNANTALKSYTDTTISTANTSLKSYVDNANTSMKSYVDNSVSTANTSMKGYVDAANTSLKSYVDTANTSLKSYVDGIKVTLDGNISANLSTAEGYTDTANTYLDTIKFNKTGGAITGYANVSANVSVGTYIDLSGQSTDPTHKEGRLWYNSTDNVTKVDTDISGISTELGRQLTMKVFNDSGVTIDKGMALYITSGEYNEEPHVAAAKADYYGTIDTLIGAAQASIANGAYGYVVTNGPLTGVNTSGIASGSVVYVSADTAGGYTNQDLAPPNYAVHLGVCLVSDTVNGVIYVDKKGIEWGANFTDGAIAFGNGYRLTQDPTELFWDYTNHQLGIGTNNPQANLHVEGSGLFTGNVIISGNLTVSNAQSIATSQLTVSGNTIIMNQGVTGSPTTDADIIVNRGSSANAIVRWDETNHVWEIDEADTRGAGEILSTLKTANTWTVYSGLTTTQKERYPIGANLANATNNLAQAGYNQANTASSIAGSGYNQANTATTLAGLAYTQANTATTLGQAAYNSGNTTLTYAQAAFASGNSTLTYAQAGFAAANTNGSAISVIQGVDLTQNTNITAAQTTASAAFAKANGAVQTGFTTISANGASITPSSNTDTLTISAAVANGINVLNPTTKTIDLGLRNSGVTAGTYGGSTNIPVIVTDAFGRITSASNVAVSTTISLAGGTGTGSVAGGGTLTFTGSTGLTTSVSGSTITLTNSGVTSLTTNSATRITQNGTTGAVTFDLATSGVTAGTYTYPSIQVDAYGRTVAISNQTPVTSFNGMTGAVTLSSANVVSALTYTPANKAGDNFTGAVIATALTSNTTVSLNGVGFAVSNTFTTASTAQVSVDSFATTTYRSAKYEVQMTSGTSYHVIELRVVHDGTNAYVTQYGEMIIGSTLGTFDASITTGVLNLLFTATNAVTTVKLIRRAIVV